MFFNIFENLAILFMINGFNRKWKENFLPKVITDGFDLINTYFAEKYDISSFSEDDQVKVSKFLKYDYRSKTGYDWIEDLRVLGNEALEVFSKYPAMKYNDFPNAKYLVKFLNSIYTTSYVIYDNIEDISREYASGEIDIFDFKQNATINFVQKQKVHSIDIEKYKKNKGLSKKSKREDRFPKNRKLGNSTKHFADFTVC